MMIFLEIMHSHIIFPEPIDLTDVIGEIAEAARPYRTLEEWFRHVEEYTHILQEKQKKDNPEGVRLMTIHAAKGLEFHTVFILDANEGRIPYKKARTDAQTEEERRLFYVAMTPGQRKTDGLLRENKKRKGNGSFPLCRRITGCRLNQYLRSPAPPSIH